MQFTTFITLAFASLATAQIDENSAETQAQPLLTLWKEPNFQGQKYELEAKFNECKPIPANVLSPSSGKAATLSSIPEIIPPVLRCTVWGLPGCKGDDENKVTFGAAGNPKFPSSIESSKAASFKCVKIRL